MENVNDRLNQQFVTSDFYISCVLKSVGLQLKNILLNKFGKATFVFENPNQTAESIIKKHWDRKLEITSLELIEAINQLKTRIHSGI